MTSSDWMKMYEQLKAKPHILERYKKRNAPKQRSCGRGRKKCSRCGRTGAHVSRFGLELCRQCFREVAPKIGFRKYD